ncbi:PTS fructose transporter subunit IIB [Haloarchaeobius sp. HRN-SO-5]|uniref:PTS fructose transporter subunit IIB n=1 Tax=Haloarchaeobius sp. HRN-SO-5 TaxID=3446118 RepID=UPI003EBE94F7
MKFVAVTSCPTGIAHSQMAAENLEQTAERLGHDIRVEVQGAMGAENELTADDVATAEAVIIAADTAVSRDRFTEVPVVKGTVKDAVNDAEGLVGQAVTAAGDSDDGSDAAASTGTADAERSSASGGTDPSSGRRGGDQEKSLLNRLKRLFS